MEQGRRSLGFKEFFSVCLLLFSIFFAATYRIFPQKPKCSITQFRVNSTPVAANSTTNNNQTTTIYFDLKLRNREIFHGIYYDPLNLTISYRPKTKSNKTMSVVAAYGFPGFYQGYHKTAHRSSLVETAVVLNGTTSETAVFRVKLDTRVRFKSVWGIKKSKRLQVAGNFEVDAVTGNKVGKKNIKLKRTNAAMAAAPRLGGLLVVVALSTAVILLVL